MAYRNNAFRRAFSAMSSVGAPKIVSNAAIREQRSWILPLTATVSCKRVCQGRIPCEGSQTNLVIRINGGDCAQGGFERTESICGLLCDVEDDGGTHEGGVLPVSLRNW